MDIRIRPARRADALHVATLVDIAGHGIDMDDWIARAGPDHSALDSARRIVADDTGCPYHFSRAFLLEVDGCIAGAGVGGIVVPEPIPPGQPDYMVRLTTLEYRRPGCWLLLTLAVYPEHRGHGHAGRLLAHALDQARDAGAPAVCLIVEDTNLAAIALYQRNGYVEVERLGWLPYGGRTGPQNWLLMARPV